MTDANDCNRPRVPNAFDPKFLALFDSLDEPETAADAIHGGVTLTV